MNLINYTDPSPWIWIFNNNGKKVMWFENPRVGSTTIKWFVGHPMKNKNTNRFKLQILKKGELAEEKQKMFNKVNESEELSDMYKFAICRDPYRRMVSNYRMLMKNPLKGSQPRKSTNGLKFDTFVDNVVTEKWKNHHFAPQHWFVPFEKIKFDNIFRLEKLSEDFQIVFDKLEVDDKELVYASSIKNYPLGDYPIEDYTKNEETLKKIEKYYAKDFELYERADV